MAHFYEKGINPAIFGILGHTNAGHRPHPTPHHTPARLIAVQLQSVDEVYKALQENEEREKLGERPRKVRSLLSHTWQVIDIEGQNDSWKKK